MGNSICILIKAKDFCQGRHMQGPWKQGLAEQKNKLPQKLSEASRSSLLSATIPGGLPTQAPHAPS